MTQTSTSNKISNAKLINLGLIISLGNCCIGYTGVCLSAVEHILEVHNGLSQDQTMFYLSISTSSLNLGAILGAIFYKKFQDKLGTLRAFTIIDVLCTFFICIQLFDLNIYYLASGRFLYGIFMTMSLAMTPSFLNKLSKIYEPSIAGTLGSFNQLLIVFGIIVAYMMAYILPKKIQETQIWTQIRWRVYIGLPIIFMLIRLYAVKTRPEYKVVQENPLTKNTKNIRSSTGNQGIKTKQRLSYKPRLIIAILVIASNQLSCINGIFFYAKQMMDLVTGNDEELSRTLMLFLAFGQFFAAMISGKLLNKYGRKIIFIKGQSIIVLILILCFFLDMNNPYLNIDRRNFLLGALINLHVIVFNLTLGPICIFYCSQILDDLGYVVLTLKCLGLLIALTFHIMIRKIGIGQMFMIFGVISLILCVYLDKYMQETKNLEKQQIFDSFIDQNVGIPRQNQPQVKPLRSNSQTQNQLSALPEF